MSGIGNFFANRLDSWRAHPFQNLMSTAGGAVAPGAGFGMQALFNRYNNNQFNNSSSQLADGLQNYMNQTNQGIWNKPLNGPLGQFSSQGGGATQPQYSTQPVQGGGYGQDNLAQMSIDQANHDTQQQAGGVNWGVDIQPHGGGSGGAPMTGGGSTWNAGGYGTGVAPGGAVGSGWAPANSLVMDALAMNGGGASGATNPMAYWSANKVR